ncbi:MAG: nuclear transport factor 2 family protein [Candidatus Acidiferrales bacterium]
MPSETALAPLTPEQALREANRRFYAAFESLDLAQIDEIWAHDDWVQCVHPGWELLVGWDEVRESWARIFSNTRRVKIALGPVLMRVEGEIGWVACTQQVMSAFAEGFEEALTQATNLFIRRDGEWRIVLHHASPLPAAPRTTVQ